MRALKLNPTDIELFHGSIDCEKHSFFYSHLSAFKRMWTEEGKVYWLRFLLTFKLYFEADLMARPVCLFFLFEAEGRQILEFLYIYIHKQFIETSCNAATKFLENVFIVSKYIHSLPEPKGMRNPFYSKNSREAFRSILGEPDFYEELPIGMITFACSVYAVFTGSICNLLKCWLRETDLSEDTVKSIDYTLLYWRPDPEWKEHFYPSCFEKYLADYWKNDLPKMLLTCDIHNIFNAHCSMNCCSGYKNEMNLFDLLKVQVVRDKPFCMKHVAIIAPDVLNCKVHSNCRVLIVHEPNCIDPYLCDASGSTCAITCEISRKLLLRDSGNVSRSISPKMSFTEICVCKKKKTRTVSTLIESSNREIVTYSNLKDQASYEAFAACEYLHFRESMCPYDDHEIRNSFNQHKKKYDLKMRLRMKLDKKQSSKCVQFSDKDYCVHLYEKARQTWLNELCQENNQNLGNKSCQKSGEKNLIECPLKYIKGLLTSVAVGTNDVIFGRVVCSTESYAAAVTAAVDSSVQSESLIQSDVNKTDTQSKSKKLKAKKKKKGKANNDCDSNPPGNCDDHAITESVGNQLITNNVNSNELLLENVIERKSDPLNDNENCDEISGKNVVENNKKKLCFVLHNKSFEQPHCFETLKDSQTPIPSKDILVVNKNFNLKEKYGEMQYFNGKLSEKEFKCDETKQSEEKIKSDKSIKEDEIQISRMKNSSKPITKVLKEKGAKEVLKEKGARELEVKDGINISKVVIKEHKNTDNSVKHEEHTSAVQISESKEKPIFENNLKGNLSTQVMLRDVCAEHQTNDTPECCNSEEMNTPIKVSPPKRNLFPKDEEAVDKFFELIGVIKKPAQEEKSELNPSLPSAIDQGTAQICDKTDKKSKLRVCAFCSEKEVEYKTFKRCGRCKVENFAMQHYYCSRACQINDWEESHRNEHLKKSKNPVLN